MRKILTILITVLMFCGISVSAVDTTTINSFYERIQIILKEDIWNNLKVRKKMRRFFNILIIIFIFGSSIGIVNADEIPVFNGNKYIGTRSGDLAVKVGEDWVNITNDFYLEADKEYEFQMKLRAFSYDNSNKMPDNDGKSFYLELDAPQGTLFGVGQQSSDLRVWDTDAINSHVYQLTYSVVNNKYRILFPDDVTNYEIQGYADNGRTYFFYAYPKLVIDNVGTYNLFGTRVNVVDALEHNVTVNYHVDSEYTWQIHSDINFGSNAGVGHTVNRTAQIGNENIGVKVTKNILPDLKELVISLADTNTFRITNGNTQLNYVVSKTNNGTALTAGEKVLGVVTGTNTGEQELFFKLSTANGTAEVAGTYTGTITYVAQIEDYTPVTNLASGLYRNGEMIYSWQELLSNNIIIDNAGGTGYIYATSNRNLLVGDLVIGDEASAIQGGAFSNCSGLTSVTITNENINLSISSEAFTSCPNLTSVTLPNSANITTIPARMFGNCSNLEEVILPDNLLTIGENAFASCPKLTLYLPNSLTSVGQYAFADILHIYYYGNLDATQWLYGRTVLN